MTIAMSEFIEWLGVEVVLMKKCQQPIIILSLNPEFQGYALPATSSQPDGAISWRFKQRWRPQRERVRATVSLEAFFNRSLKIFLNDSHICQ
jgi:hypothetical protein